MTNIHFDSDNRKNKNSRLLWLLMFLLFFCCFFFILILFAVEYKLNVFSVLHSSNGYTTVIFRIIEMLLKVDEMTRSAWVFTVSVSKFSCNICGMVWSFRIGYWPELWLDLVYMTDLVMQCVPRVKIVLLTSVFKWHSIQ